MVTGKRSSAIGRCAVHGVQARRMQSGRWVAGGWVDRRGVPSPLLKLEPPSVSMGSSRAQGGCGRVLKGAPPANA